MQVCVSESTKCSFFGKFRVLCFLETPVLRFAFLPFITDDNVVSIFHLTNYNKRETY